MLSVTKRCDLDQLCCKPFKTSVHLLVYVCVQKQTDELSRSYISFMRVSLDQMRQNVADELYILTLFEVLLLS